MTKAEKQLQIAIETKNFITDKRDKRFHQAVAKRFKSWTMWFPGCVVHHWDENPCNNHPLNLGCMTRSEHMSLHMKGNKHNVGKKASDKTRNKMSKTRIGNTYGKRNTKNFLIINGLIYTIAEVSLKFNFNLKSLRSTVSQGKTKFKELNFTISK